MATLAQTFGLVAADGSAHFPFDMWAVREDGNDRVVLTDAGDDPSPFDIESGTDRLAFAGTDAALADMILTGAVGIRPVTGEDVPLGPVSPAGKSRKRTARVPVDFAGGVGVATVTVYAGRSGLRVSVTVGDRAQHTVRVTDAQRSAAAGAFGG